MITRRRWMEMTLGATAAELSLRAFTAPVPRPAPDVEILLSSGEPLLLSSLRGKVVALEFLLTDCIHCQRCSGILQQMYQEFGPKGFQPVGAAINDNARALVPTYMGNLGLKYPVGVTPRKAAYDFLGYGMDEPLHTPQLVFIDRKGLVRAQYSGDGDFFRNEEVNVRNQIEAMLKGAGAKPAGAKKPAKK